MDTVRIKVRVKPARGEISLDDVSSLISNVVTFLDNVSRDSGITLSKKNWTAANFKNESIGFDANLQVESRSDTLKENIQSIVSRKNQSQLSGNGIRKETIESYWAIPKPLAPNDKFSVGVYQNGLDSNILGDEFTQCDAVYELSKLEKTVDEIDKIITYYGSIRGVVHAWYKEVENPHVVIRDIIYGKLVKCFYHPDEYQEIYKLLKDKTAIIIMNGHIEADKEKQEPKSIKIDKVETTPDFQEEDIDKFIGCVPHLTGGLTSGEYIESLYEEN